MRLCSVCSIEHPIDHYYMRKAGPQAGTRLPHCKACAYRKARVHLNNRRTREAGIPAPKACEVCGETFGSGKGKSPCFDHNHGTGCFRGWLCSKCNSALGMAGDNPDLLVKLSEYLKDRGFTKVRG